MTILGLNTPEWNKKLPIISLVHKALYWTKQKLGLKYFRIYERFKKNQKIQNAYETFSEEVGTSSKQNLGNKHNVHYLILNK